MQESTDHLFAHYRSQGSSHLALGQRAVAVELLSYAVAIARTFGEQDPRLAESEALLGMAHKDRRSLRKAVVHLGRALALADRQPAARPRFTLQLLQELCEAHLLLKRADEAEPLARRALVLVGALHGAASWKAALAKVTLASALVGQARLSEAEPLFRQALVIFQADADPDTDTILCCIDDLVGIYRAQQRYAEAADLLGRKVALLRAGGGRRQALKKARALQVAFRDLASSCETGQLGPRSMALPP